HPLAGVLSAVGIGAARAGWHGQADVGGVPLTPELELEALFARLEREGQTALAGEGAREARATRRVDLRYRGTHVALTVPWGAPEGPRALFERAHSRAFGYVRPGHLIEVVSARVELQAPGAEFDGVLAEEPGDRPVPERSQVWI